MFERGRPYAITHRECDERIIHTMRESTRLTLVESRAAVAAKPSRPQTHRGVPAIRTLAIYGPIPKRVTRARGPNPKPRSAYLEAASQPPRRERVANSETSLGPLLRRETMYNIIEHECS